MQDAEMQFIATNIVVISVALLAIVLVILSHTWQSFLHYFGLLSAQGRRDISNLLLGFIVVSSIVYGGLMAMGVVGPKLVQSAFLVVMLGLGIFSIGYLAYTAAIVVWNLVWHRQLPRFPHSKEPDVEQWEKFGVIFYSTAVFNLLLATISFAISVMGAMDTTVGINIRPDPAEDVDFSRWSLSAGTIAFFFGLLLLAIGKYADLHRFLDSKVKGEEVVDSTPEDNGSTDQDEANDKAVENRQK